MRFAIAKIRTASCSNSVEISGQPIPLSTATEDNSVWGVATWVDVDPRIDFFSIYINGLTNAYRWTDPRDGVQGGRSPGDRPAIQAQDAAIEFLASGRRIRFSKMRSTSEPRPTRLPSRPIPTIRRRRRDAGGKRPLAGRPELG